MKIERLDRERVATAAVVTERRAGEFANLRKIQRPILIDKDGGRKALEYAGRDERERLVRPLPRSSLASSPR